jgi:hypothetical protein
MATLEYACTAWPYRLVSSAAWRRVLAALPVTNPDEQCGDRVQPPFSLIEPSFGTCSRGPIVTEREITVHHVGAAAFVYPKGIGYVKSR